MPQIHRERVLRAATSQFLTRGYRSSVDEIARRAGVAKQTVYQHFPSKDELFKEVARDLTRRVLVELDTGPRDVRAGLMRVARAYRKRVLGTQGIATLRTVVPEVPRFPALARAPYGVLAAAAVSLLPGWARRPLRLPRLPVTETVLVRPAGHAMVRAIRWATSAPPPVPL